MSKQNKIAEDILQALKNKSAPWVKPWTADNIQAGRPYNPVTGTKYKGVNFVYLSIQGKNDKRWVTFNQAKENGWQVKRGSKGCPIQFWQFDKEKKIKNETGKIVIEKTKLERPLLRHYYVFNAEDIAGIPEQSISDTKEPKWKKHDRVDNILNKSEAKISHIEGDSAAYLPLSDEIQLPKKGQFASADKYYSTALHELGHWTGHKTRLDRDLGEVKGSKDRAKEELRAEIASYMIGMETGIGHDPKNHVAYIDSWVAMLENKPTEIFKACADAEKINNYILDFEKEKSQEVDKMTDLNMPEQDLSKSEELQAIKEKSSNKEKYIKREDKKYLAVSFADKDKAKKLGAMWSKEAKSWYIPQGMDDGVFSEWLGNNNKTGDNIQQQFSSFIENMGGDLKGPPVMDGKIQRIDGSGKKGNKKIAYCGFVDGVPAGWVKDWGGEQKNWVSSGTSLSQEQKNQLSAEKLQKKEARMKEIKILQEETAMKSLSFTNNLSLATGKEKYFTEKGLKVIITGAKVDPKGGGIVVPMKDVAGKQWSHISLKSSGFKKVAKNSRIHGTFALVGAKAISDIKEDIYIAEGYSTGTTVSQAINQPVIVTGTSNNLLPVAKSIKKRFPHKNIYIVADDDKHLKINVGMVKAKEAAKAVKGGVISPFFNGKNDSKDKTDFRDMMKEQGIEAVKKKILVDKSLNFSRKKIENKNQILEEKKQVMER